MKSRGFSVPHLYLISTGLFIGLAIWVALRSNLLFYLSQKLPFWIIVLVISLMIGILISYILFLKLEKNIYADLTKESIKSMQELGQKLSKYSLAILTISISLTGLTSIAASFLLNGSSLKTLGSEMVGWLYLVLMAIVFAILICNFGIWINMTTHSKKESKDMRRDYIQVIHLFLISIFLVLLMSLVGFSIFQLPSYDAYVKIDKVTVGGAAYSSNLKEGMIINSINGREVKTTEDFTKIMSNTTKGDVAVVITNKGVFNVTLNKCEWAYRGCFDIDLKPYIFRKRFY